MDFILKFFLLIISYSISFYLYRTDNELLKILRAIVIYFLLTLLFYPFVYKESEIEIKPGLIILEDLSASVEPYKEKISVLSEKLWTDKELNEKFSVSFFTFSDKILNDFSEKPGEHTDIYQTLWDVTHSFLSGRNNAIVIFTDGIQTKGKDYTLFPVDNNTVIFPVVIGDTVKHPNLKIERVIYNDVVAKDNYFYIKTQLTAENIDRKIPSEFLIKEKGRVKFRKKITFTPNKNFVQLDAKLSAYSPGYHTYELIIKNIPGEKNLSDNKKIIRIQVTEKKARILLLTSKIHPDAGVFKRILSTNKSYEIEVKNTIPPRKAYDLIIVIQPQPAQLESLQKINTPKLWITGKFTDWEALNRFNDLFKRNVKGNLKEEYFAYENPDFSLFQLKKLPAHILPPLTDLFGNIVLKQPGEAVYYAKVKSYATKQPLFVIFKEKKQAAIFGQGLWKWYIYEKKENKADHIEDLVKKTVDFLVSETKTQQLQVHYEKQYTEGQPVIVRISAFNTLLEPDPKANLSLWLYSPDGSKKKIPVYYEEPFFAANLGVLNPGTYRLKVYYPRYQLTKQVFFDIIKLPPEVPQTAQTDKLQILAEMSGGKIFFENNLDSLKQSLLTHPAMKTIIKTERRKINVLNNYYFILFLLLLLSLEWIIRKYKGML